MAKKRRTKAQKIRAQLRRSDGAMPVPKSAAPSAPVPSVPPEIHEPAEKPVITAAVQSRPRHSPETTAAAKPKRPLDLRLSLMLLGSLVAAQLILWLVFRLTLLDETIYSLIDL